MSKVDDWNAARLGRATGRHPFTGRGSDQPNACVICVHGPNHEVHQGGEVISLDQFRARRNNA